MARIESFEDLIAWQRARTLVAEVYAATRSAPFSRDFALVNQIRRAAVSVQNNIAEGWERGTRSELGQALTVSKGSAGEVRSMLYNALDLGYLEPAEFERLRSLALEVSRLVSSLRASVREQREADRSRPRTRSPVA